MKTTILGLNFEDISRFDKQVVQFQTISWFKLFRSPKRAENIHKLRWKKKGFSQNKILVAAAAPGTLISECV